MKYPGKDKLGPLAMQFIQDAGYKVLPNGKVTNNRNGGRYTEWCNIYALGRQMVRDRMIVKIRPGEYNFVDYWRGMRYPYVRN